MHWFLKTKSNLHHIDLNAELNMEDKPPPFDEQ